jgi:deoxyribodipyrimidine photolyase-related protein
MTKETGTLRLVVIFGDQLTEKLSALREAERGHDVVLMAELREETSYVAHHKKKIAFVFSAMRHFANELRNAGWNVDYVPYGRRDNTGSFAGEVWRAVERHRARAIIITQPGEWRLAKEASTWGRHFGIEVRIIADDRFVCDVEEFQVWAKGRKQLRLENFYRHMRRKTGLLMNGDQPEGGRWNYDQENRKPLPFGHAVPTVKSFRPDRITREVLSLVAENFPDHFGSLNPFDLAVTRTDAEDAFDDFIRNRLGLFGDYQDAIAGGRPILFHSLAAMHFNNGLLDPLESCRKIEQAYRNGQAPLNAAEGFIRQVIGWREFIRGIYWLKMPGYQDENAFGHKRPLPDFYWTGKTDMACLVEAIGQTRELAYAHHIQRLMVTGNFAMLAGIDPHAVHQWYLAVYLDAYEWVELPNTIGMSQFADGGIFASKPYAASGRYIEKMSDHCKQCRFNVKLRSGPDACPFNALYWDFIARNRKKLSANRRMGLIYSVWDRMSEDDRRNIRRSAKTILESL